MALSRRSASRWFSVMVNSTCCLCWSTCHDFNLASYSRHSDTLSTCSHHATPTLNARLHRWSSSHDFNLASYSRHSDTLSTCSHHIIHHTETTRRIATPPKEDRVTAICNVHVKLAEDRTSSLEDMFSDIQTDRQTDKQKIGNAHQYS